MLQLLPKLLSKKKAIEMFNNCPSILKINEMRCNRNVFSFKYVSDLNIHDVINNMSKAYQKDNIPPILLKDNIPPKLLKENNNTCVVISLDINQCIDTASFPSNLKIADITPLFKKIERSMKRNFRPVSILTTLSNIYEKMFFSKFMNILILFSQNTYRLQKV